MSEADAQKVARATITWQGSIRAEMRAAKMF